MIRIRVVLMHVCLAGLGLLAGCVNQAKEVAKYREVVQTPGQVVPSIRPGQPLSLEDALLLANEYNERINLQGEAYLQSLIARDRAAATFLPTISLAPSYLRQDLPSSSGSVSAAGASGGAAAGAFSAQKERTDVILGGGWNAFNGPVALANYQAAGKTIAQRRALLLDAQAAVLIDVAHTFYQALRAEQSVEVLRNAENTQRTNVSQQQARLKSGLGKPLDVEQARAQLSATRVSLLNAQNDVVNARVTLSFLVGVDVSGNPLRDDAQVPEAMAPLEELQQIAQRSRQDLAAARAGVVAARYQVNAAIGQYFPSVTFNFNYYLSRESIPTESEWNALLSANLPIFTGGAIYANVRNAWSLFRQAKLLESQARRQVIQEVATAYENLRVSRERLQQLGEGVRYAKGAYTLAKGFYEAGLKEGTYLNLLIATDQLLSAQLQLASERYNQKVFYLNLLRAMGTLSTRLPGEAAPSTRPTTAPAPEIGLKPTTRPVAQP